MTAAATPDRGRSDRVLPGRFFHEHMHRAFEQGVAPDFSLGDPGDWIKTLDELLVQGRVELARYGLTHLREQSPDLQWPESVVELLDLMPEGSPRIARFVDDRESDLQVVPVAGARTVVIGFCGRRNRLNMPLWLFQRWMAKLDVSVIYLRDFDDLSYVGGVRSCGSFEGSLDRLRRTVEALKAERIVCLGNSSGGYAALRYGLELGAARVFSFSGAVNMEPEFNTYLNRREGAERLAQAFPDLRLDLRELYLAAQRRPEAVLIYGEKAWDDRIHNEHMAGVPGVFLEPVPGYPGHGAMPELIRRGQFDQVLERIGV